MVKTNSKKSVIALVVMAILLVLSMAMTITGAWFTDDTSKDSGNLTFGTVVLGEISSVGTAITNDITSETALLMPGSEVTATVPVLYTGTAKAWIRFKLTVSKVGDTGADASSLLVAAAMSDAYEVAEDGYVYVKAMVEANQEAVDHTVTYNIDTATGNTYQGAVVKISVVVEAIQAANTASSAKAAFEMVNSNQAG